MRGAVIHAPGDARFEERQDPVITHPTDVIIRIVATCSFFASDNSCPICRSGFQSSCVRRAYVGAGGLSAVIAAKHLGAERIIAMSRHQDRQQLARELGATDIVTERGDEGAVAVKELTDGLGADAVLECVGTQESMMQAIRATRPGGGVGYVGVSHGVELAGEELFYSHVRLLGGPAPARRFLPELIDLTMNGIIEPGKVFDLELPLEQVAEGYRAMDERRAVKALLHP